MPSLVALQVLLLFSFIAVLSKIAISSLNDQYGCGSFYGQPESMSSDSTPMCSSSGIAYLISSSPLFFSCFCLDSHSVVSNCGHGVYSNFMLHW